MPLLDAPQWDAFLSHHPQAHLLQTSAWGELKSRFGWGVARLENGSIGAQILLRRLPGGARLAYIPRGPVWNPHEFDQAGSAHMRQAWQAFWDEMDEVCRARRCILLKVEADAWEGELDEAAVLPLSRFILSPHSVQPLRTLVIDINQPEAAVLAQMKQKTRYNLNLAIKKGVEAYQDDDLAPFYHLMTATGQRDAFEIHSQAYYQAALELFAPRGECALFYARYQGEVLAGLMAFAQGSRAWYFYGASSNNNRQVMAPYLLQWEAIRWARALGCRTYDLWGVPDYPHEALEAGFSERSDGLWGVYRFKRGFGGELRRAVAPRDRAYSQPLYRLYRWWIGRRGEQAG